LSRAVHLPGLTIGVALDIVLAPAVVEAATVRAAFGDE